MKKTANKASVLKTIHDLGTADVILCVSNLYRDHPEDAPDILREALANEKANKRRAGVLKVLESTLAKLAQDAKASKAVAKTAAVRAAVVKASLSPADMLNQAAALAREASEKINTAQEAFFTNTMPDRLRIGLAGLMGHAAHAITAKGKKSAGIGFEQWLAETIPGVKRGAAYKYMHAASGLGLTAESPPTAIEEALKAWPGSVTIAALVSASTLALGDGKPDPAPEPDEFTFMKNAVSDTRASVETLIDIAPKLSAEFKRAASAQLMAGLVALTGSHWAPSDEPCELETVDPSSIKI